MDIDRVHYITRVDYTNRLVNKVPMVVPCSNAEGLISKKNAWIVYICNWHKEIISIDVFDLSISNRDKIISDVSHELRDMQMYTIDLTCDQAREVNLEDIIFKLACYHNFENKYVMKMCL